MKFGQSGWRLRFDWGREGAEAVAPGAAVVAVVDVLSFTTALTIAVERGIAVLPCRWGDDAARAVASANDAVLAVGRSRAGPGRISLSPAGILAAAPGVRRLVLPSPNGSAISAALARLGVPVVGVSLRNARAAAAWVRGHTAGKPVAVVAAGERRPDGSLRPAVEDLWGAGAFLDELVALAPAGGAGRGDDVPGRGLSPEAGAAVGAYRAVAGRVGAALRACGSGLELREMGFGGDVEVAGKVGVSDVVPVLVDGWFVDGGKGRRAG